MRDLGATVLENLRRVTDVADEQILANTVRHHNTNITHTNTNTIDSAQTLEEHFLPTRTQKKVQNLVNFTLCYDILADHIEIRGSVSQKLNFSQKMVMFCLVTQKITIGKKKNALHADIAVCPIVSTNSKSNQKW